MDRGRLTAAVHMSGALRAMALDKRRQVAREIAEVAHSAPPGVNRLDYLRELLARQDAGRLTYEDVIALEACSRPDLLRLTVQLLSGAKA